MKYICLKCRSVRKKKIGEKTYPIILLKGKIIRVPVCCGFKMEIYEHKDK